MNKLIVDWAPYGSIIPLVCSDCGMIFNTENIGHIGARTIHCGFNKEEDITIGFGCKNRNHEYIPNEDMYKKSEREKQMDELFNSMKNKWKTNPDITFGNLLASIENENNAPIYILSDEDIIKLVNVVDISNYANKEFLYNEIKNLCIDVIYDETDNLVGYSITSSNSVPIREMTNILDDIDVDYECDIKPIMLHDGSGFIDRLVCEDVIFNSIDLAKNVVKQIENYYNEIFKELD